MKSYWLFKTEPGTYSFAQLLKEGKTNWNGVRNFQARNFLKEASQGDLALIYHSGDEKCVIGIARVAKGAYPDPDPKKPGDWFQIDLEPVEKLPRPVPLKEIKATASLKGLLLVKHTRLSCMPMTARDFETVVRMGRSKA